MPTPAGAVAGDVLVAAIDVRGSLSTWVTPPTGFDLVRRDVNGTSLTTAVYTHVVRATDPLSHTFQFSRSQGSTGIILAFSGVDGAAPVVSSGVHAQSQTARITAPSVSGSTAPLYLVGIFASSSQTTIAAPSGMTERQERSLSSGTYRITTSVATEVVAAERSGTRTARAGSTATSLGQLMVLRPAR